MKRSFALVLALFVVGCAPAPDAPDHHGADAAAPHDHPDKLVRAGTGATVVNPFHPIRLLLSNTETSGDLTVYHLYLPPGSPGSPPHTHTLDDEYFFVVSGTLDVLSNGEVLRLEPGDFAALNRGHAHMFWNGSDAPTEVIMTTTGSSFEAFMERVAPSLAEAKPQSAQDAGAVIGRLAAEHGITIAMEMMPEEAAPFYVPAPPPGG